MAMSKTLVPEVPGWYPTLHSWVMDSDSPSHMAIIIIANLSPIPLSSKLLCISWYIPSHCGFSYRKNIMYIYILYHCISPNYGRVIIIQSSMMVYHSISIIKSWYIMNNHGY